VVAPTVGVATVPGAAARLHGPRRFAARLGELSQARALSHTT